MRACCRFRFGAKGAFWINKGFVDAVMQPRPIDR